MTNEEFKAANIENYKIAIREPIPIKTKNTGNIDAQYETHINNTGSHKGYSFRFNGESYFLATREETDAFMAVNDYFPCHNRYNSVTYQNAAIHDAYVKEKAERDKDETEISQARVCLYEAARKHLFDNGNEIVYIGYGCIPESGYSYNHRDNHGEKGVSVYKAAKIGNNYYIDIAKNCFTYMGIENRSCYIVTGELLDEVGSDEEPLLKNAVIRKQISNDSIKTVRDFLAELFA